MATSAQGAAEGVSASTGAGGGAPGVKAAAEKPAGVPCGSDLVICATHACVRAKAEDCWAAACRRVPNPEALHGALSRPWLHKIRDCTKAGMRE